jgi:hypothetical protein
MFDFPQGGVACVIVPSKEAGFHVPGNDIDDVRRGGEKSIKRTLLYSTPQYAAPPPLLLFFAPSPSLA